jgi:hypothetical protein
MRNVLTSLRETFKKQHVMRIVYLDRLGTYAKRTLRMKLIVSHSTVL